MIRSTSILLWTTPLLLAAFATDLYAQRPPYDVFPPAEPPYYRVRYDAQAQKGELVYPVNYTIWVPKGVKSLRGVIVHQHGCGEGSCKSGLTGAYDLHWQALARKHDCALLAPAYEQPDKADCQMWCDPRNGSDAAFQKCLVDLGVKSGHPELAKIPWALWGHSGGGHWAGGMVLLHPERVAAAWLRSGVPLLKANPERATIKAHTLLDAALKVPMMCNLGTKEGVTEKGKQFAGVWPANEAFFNEVRGKGGLIGVAVDPLTSHECGNQRYLAIPWLDACLTARLPKASGDPLQAMPTDKAWLAQVTGAKTVRAAEFAGDPHKLGWLPNEAIAKAWMQYVKDTAVTDTTPPPAPTNLRLKGNDLIWEAEADPESGLAGFIIERDGQFLANVPEKGKNAFGRPVFQNLQYSDTPTQSLVPMRYVDTKAEPGKKHTYRVIAVNTLGLKSMPSAAPVTIGARAGELEVTAIQAVHRHGQTFVTWKDVAEGEEGSRYRYSLYRSHEPITAANLDKAEICYHGVLNCSAKLFGHVFNMKDRLDASKPYAIIEEGGKPLPPWSGLAVHTVQKPGKAYYAVVATDEKLKPVSAVVPGKSATTKAIEEKPGPIQAIKLYDSKERKTYVAQTSITGQKGLPLSVSLHGSQGQGGPAGEWGDYYLYFGTPDMGYRDGMPGVFTVQENRAKEGNSLLLRPRDAIEHPSGRGAFETMWLGYYCIPHGAMHKEPRYYRFTENRLLWMIDWSLKRYGGDPQRVSMGGSSMGGLGSINVGFRHPELFAAAYPSTAPFLWWPPSSLHGLQKRDTRALMADGITSYIDYTNSPRFAAEQNQDMPFLGWAVGRKDPNHNWQEYVDMVKALTANHHGFCFAWNDGGHSEGARPMATITKYYPAAKFARNRSYPAFGNSSIDNKLGNGSKDEGDREGGINLGFDWKDLVDEEARWSLTVSNDLTKEPMTVDVTPRRCQKFRPKPGTECKWTTSTGASGTAIADKWGLVTAPRVGIKAGMATVLTIQAAR